MGRPSAQRWILAGALGAGALAVAPWILSSAHSGSAMPSGMGTEVIRTSVAASPVQIGGSVDLAASHVVASHVVASHVVASHVVGNNAAANALQSVASVEEYITLSDRCPPSFERLEGDVCKLVTLYDPYTTLRGHGVGGTKTRLPEARDGFTAQQIDLGRYLFFDPMLSGNGTVSCASCHHPDKGFSDDLPVSIGVAGTETHRAAPTLWNSAFLKRLFWDSRANSLEEQAMGPLYAADEMGNTPQQLEQSLQANAEYRRLFAEAFPGSENIALPMVYTALSAFEASLISLNSRYDRYAHGYHAALTQEEIEGLNVFRSFVARCAECHTPPLFTNQQVAAIGTPEPEGRPLDVGAEKTYGSPKLKGAFKVPTLRNIATTAPYMHSGRFGTLREAVEFYNGGRGHAVPEGVEMQLHWHIWTPNLTDHELDLIVAFLQTLTDETFKPVIPARVPSGLTPINHQPDALNNKYASANQSGESQ